MKKALAGFLLGIIATLGLAAVAIDPVMTQVLKRVQIDTTRLPKVYFRFDTDLYPERQCWYIDTARINQAIVVGWMPLSTYIDFSGKLFGITSLTQAERDFCFSTMLPPPVVAPTVASTATSMTLYAPTWITTGVKTSIGTVAVNTPCEVPIALKTTVEYHYVTNASGLRGLATCK